MKKKLCRLLPICLICPFLIAADEYMSTNEARKFVEEGLYSKIDEIVNKTKKETIFDDDYVRIYGKDRNGNAIYLTPRKKYPNDMFILNGGGAKQVSAQTFFGELTNLVKTNNVEFRWKCIGARYCKQPEVANHVDAKEFAIVIIQKEWNVNGNRTIVIDTVEVNLKYKNIAQIHNCVVPLHDSPEETLEEMMAKAAGLYDRACKLDKWYRFCKRREAIPFYNEAFVLYGKIAEKDPNLAYYHLGVMYFKGQGNGKNMTKKQRLNMAEECWRKSNLKKACRAIAYISDGRRGC